MNVLNKIYSGLLPLRLVKHLVNSVFIYYIEENKIYVETNGVKSEISQEDLDLILDVIKDSDVHSIKVTDVSQSQSQHINLINDGDYIQRCN